MSPSGQLALDEPHPAANFAKAYLRAVIDDWPTLRASFSSCAIEGNRLAEVCAETMRRLEAGEPVSDRYLMGLAWAAWFVLGMKDERQEVTQ